MGELFVEHDLPEIYRYDELTKKFEELSNGNKNIKNDIIYHNIRLVIDIVNKYYHTEPYFEKKDLVSIGIIGLINSVNTYNMNKKVKFSTYARKCIRNEIGKFLVKNKKLILVDSLDRKTNNSDDSSDSTFAESLCDYKQNVEEEIVIKDRNERIRKIVNNIPGNDGHYIRMYFGFGCTPKSTIEISKTFNVSRQYIYHRISFYVKL